MLLYSAKHRDVLPSYNVDEYRNRILRFCLVSAIQKDWKDENTNLAETILQIIRHFEFMERNEKP